MRFRRGGKEGILVVYSEIVKVGLTRTVPVVTGGVGVITI